jgi:excisionase family DNA binding protein
MGNMDGAETVPRTDERIVAYPRLVSEMTKKGHSKAASEWAIHALAREKKLLVWCGESDGPSWQNPGGAWQGGGTCYLAGLEHSEVQSTPELWEPQVEVTRPVLPFASATVSIRPGPMPGPRTSAPQTPSQSAAAFGTAADQLRTLKVQFEQLANLGWGCEASYYLPSRRADGFNGWEPVSQEVPNTSLLRSVGLLLPPLPITVPPGTKPPPWTFEAQVDENAGTFRMTEPAIFNFVIHSDRRRSTPADCEACDRFSTIASYAGECLRSLDLRRLTFAGPRTPTAQGPAEAFWLLIVFDLAWQHRPAGLRAEQDRIWRTGNVTQRVPYKSTRENLQSWFGQFPGSHPDRFYADLLDHYPENLPEFFVSNLDGIAMASALAVDILITDLRRLAKAALDEQLCDTTPTKAGPPAGTVSPAGAESPPSPAKQTPEENWLTVSQAATLSWIDKGTISRLADRGELKTNGLKGKQRRIDSADLNRFLLQRAEKPEREETNEQVEKKLRRAQQPPR